MDYSGASSYIYAKASGLLTKAYVGENAVRLFNAKSLSELWELVIGSSVPQVSEKLLADKIESEAVAKFVSDYTSLLKLYSHPDKFLVELLHRYDVENIKVMSAALSLGEKEIPETVNLGEYEFLKFEAWPDLKKITEGSIYSWYDHIPSIEERQQMDYRLDLQEIKLLWKSVNKVSDSSRDALVSYYTTEYKIQNMLWALRLKIYYSMSKDEIVKNLFYIGNEPSENDPLCKDALEILDKDPANFADWKKWRYAEYLNPQTDAGAWKIDPMWIEQRLRVGEVHRAKKIFHQYPVTYASLVMYFRIKQQELNVIRAAVESLRLNAEKSEAMYVAGVTDKSE